ncbi:hypothetical protein F5Y07DRAFT_153437 [Xylaria sp. FL0933]|nr:hypothetical protein F5Y07DRAFT_153437 [Xylaria sp. FL0933]
MLLRPHAQIPAHFYLLPTASVLSSVTCLKPRSEPLCEIFSLWPWNREAGSMYVSDIPKFSELVMKVVFPGEHILAVAIVGLLTQYDRHRFLILQ